MKHNRFFDLDHWPLRNNKLQEYLFDVTSKFRKNIKKHQEVIDQYAKDLVNIPGFYKILKKDSTVMGIRDKWATRYHAVSPMEDYYEREPSDDLPEVLLRELTIQYERIEESLEYIKQIEGIISDSFEGKEYERCDYCGRFFEIKDIFGLPFEKNGKCHICSICYDDEFFRCRKCGKTFPMSEKGEDAEDYGWYCKECIQDIGFPKEVIIDPRMPYCEQMAFSDCDAMLKYLDQCGNIFVGADPITLFFQEEISDNYALYKSEEGTYYEISALDYRGYGSMEEVEADECSDSDDEEDL